MMDSIAAGLRPATVLINSASLFEYDLAADWGIDGFDRQMAVNLRAPLQLAQRMIADLPEDLSEKETGCVVNLLDQKLFNLNPDFYSYTISKPALRGATELLAQAAPPH